MEQKSIDIWKGVEEGGFTMTGHLSPTNASAE